ncbi:hypothetical protein AeMF1_007719 [Aphanomyces euteiches]|nr:hypothetical protein AeMF1_007719 [Aphanomyces euteiches]
MAHFHICQLLKMQTAIQQEVDDLKKALQQKTQDFDEAIEFFGKAIQDLRCVAQRYQQKNRDLLTELLGARQSIHDLSFQLILYKKNLDTANAEIASVTWLAGRGRLKMKRRKLSKLKSELKLSYRLRMSCYSVVLRRVRRGGSPQNTALSERYACIGMQHAPCMFFELSMKQLTHRRQFASLDDLSRVRANVALSILSGLCNPVVASPVKTSENQVDTTVAPVALNDADHRLSQDYMSKEEITAIESQAKSSMTPKQVDNAIAAIAVANASIIRDEEYKASVENGSIAEPKANSVKSTFAVSISGMSEDAVVACKNEDINCPTSKQISRLEGSTSKQEWSTPGSPASSNQQDAVGDSAIKSIQCDC